MEEDRAVWLRRLTVGFVESSLAGMASRYGRVMVLQERDVESAFVNAEMVMSVLDKKLSGGSPSASKKVS